ncbi:DUF4371 domain-containing protein [Trichonephila clavipes]|nr:DUF4371 domain-containing protein [Trichonephila clavipes]
MGEKKKKCLERRNLAETAQQFMGIVVTRCCLNPVGVLPMVQGGTSRDDVRSVVILLKQRNSSSAWERVTLFGGVRETHSPNSVSCKQQEQGRCKNCSCNFRDRRPPITTNAFIRVIQMKLDTCNCVRMIAAIEEPSNVDIKRASQFKSSCDVTATHNKRNHVFLVVDALIHVPPHQRTTHFPFKPESERLTERPTRAQVASYEIAELIAVNLKPHNLAEEIILPACRKIVKAMIGGSADIDICKIPLSDYTIHRRIKGMSENIEQNTAKTLANSNFALQVDETTDITGNAQLIAFLRFIHENDIINQFLCCRELPDFATAKVEEKQFETLNKETATHIGIREAEDWFRPIDLAKECDIYISSRSGSHKETPITYGYTQDPFKNKSQNFKTKIKENYPQYHERENKNCFICGDSSHCARDCEKRFKSKESNDHIHNKTNVNTLKIESEKQNSEECANLQYVNIFCGKSARNSID